jgi:hypothetical protein
MPHKRWKNTKQYTPQSSQYITGVKQIILSARAKAYTAVNSAMVEAYWLIGIVR